MTEQEWEQHLSAIPETGENVRYRQTVGEIRQQPATWKETASLMTWSAGTFVESLKNARSIVLTGSGSSLHGVECAALSIAEGLNISVVVIPGDDILTGAEATLPDADLMVSISRSGDSPESYAAIDLALSARPRMRHLVITCNVNGRLATEFRLSDRVRVIALDERTNDRGLVMTSSTTNLIVALQFLGMVTAPDRYKARVAGLSSAAAALIETHGAGLATVARRPFERVLYLGSGSFFGAAREAAKKMLELTDGRVATLAESYLSLRHGPVAFVREDTLVVAFLSSSERSRRYEFDVIRDLNRRRVGCGKVVAGSKVPLDLLGEGDYAVHCDGIDDHSAVVHIVAGQLLALFTVLPGGDLS